MEEEDLGMKMRIFKDKDSVCAHPRHFFRHCFVSLFRIIDNILVLLEVRELIVGY